MSAAVVSAVLRAERDVQVETAPAGTLGADDVRVRVISSGICGSDLAAYRGHHPYKRPPAVLGHELAGTVTEVGTGVRDVRPGDRVATFAYAPCLRCAACRRGDPHLCSDRENLSAGRLGGTLAEEVVLRASMVCVVPPRMPSDAVVLIEPLAISAHAAALAVLDGRSVCVIGCGTIGLGCVIAARAAGAASIRGIDRGDGKRDRFIATGGDAFVDVRQAAVRELPDEDVVEHDVVVVATAYPGVLDDAVRLTRPGGTVIVVSYFPDAQVLHANDAVSKEIAIRGSALSTRRDVAAVIAWWEAGLVEPGTLISHRFALAAAPDAFALMDGGGDDLGKIIVEGSAS
ncbi:alcohol dehydrogenase catalytic domain-containing protein [Clavibacter sp. VKM Ac-2873]|uniref:zinc-dependent alcohol dehydrogenase n=1 Tax=Clavibacter sp. VKM Ac-2873 TaxID=2783813 RepID=UPI00188B5EDF|nr:alcohol dehydrogenase catalytic domain-containing protein [Clavibacter sp. VKM Ac-2873]MBF4619278.1 alcohol dehydrogenase catalytic domain-containing protein [Clavibacter sp. VKM Ac-2873]